MGALRSAAAGAGDCHAHQFHPINFPELQAVVDDDCLKADGRILKEKGELVVTKAAIDERLDEHGYSVSGLGDAGDRMFGKK